jgi:two-component sensor histidine kinase
VHVTLDRGAGLCRLCVADDGSGMAEGSRGSGVGQALVSAFVGELGGEVSTDTDEGGTRITVTFAA